MTWINWSLKICQPSHSKFICRNKDYLHVTSPSRFNYLKVLYLIFPHHDHKWRCSLINGHVVKVIYTLSLRWHQSAVLMCCFTYTAIISGAARRVLIALQQSLLLISMIYRMIVWCLYSATSLSFRRCRLNEVKFTRHFLVIGPTKSSKCHT